YFVAQAVAEKLGLPLLAAHYLPVGSTAAFPNCLFPELPDGFPGRALYNRLTHGLVAGLLWHGLHGPLNQGRRKGLGLAPLARGGGGVRGGRPRAGGDALRLLQQTPGLFGYSPRVLPRPSDWGPDRAVTGYWILPSPSWQPPAGLAAFLEAGPPPVCVGFGSM